MRTLIRPAIPGKPEAGRKPIFREWRSASRGENRPGLAGREDEWKRLQKAALAWQGSLPKEIPPGCLSKLRKK